MPVVGKSCPTFPLEVNGATKDFNEYVKEQGWDNVVVDFYTNWCTECPKAAKQVSGLATGDASGKTGYMIVNLEGDEDAAKEFVQKHSVSNKVVSCTIDDDELPADFEVKGIPHKLVVESGVVTMNGTDVDLEALPFASSTPKDEGEKTAAAVEIAPGADSVACMAKFASTEGTGKEYMGSKVSKLFKSYEKDEEILKENEFRWVMFPLQYPQV